MMSPSRNILSTTLTLLFLGWSGIASAQNLLWTNSAGSNAITAVDKTTGAIVRSFSPGKGNGRGVVTVGNTVYYTVANSGNVFKLNATTGADLGVAFSVAGASGLSNMAFDGTNFWISDYSGTKNAFYVSPSGTLIKTISLVNCASFCDGLEFFNGKLISNRGDSLTPGIYDIYDTNGNLLQANFITGVNNARGIAFDGTQFYVSSGSNTVNVYNGTTGAFVRTMTLSGASYNLEDLSLDYVVVIPTMTEWMLRGLALVLMLAGAWALRKRRFRTV